jgi:hypothetical protein
MMAEMMRGLEEPNNQHTILNEKLYQMEINSYSTEAETV